MSFVLGPLFHIMLKSWGWVVGGGGLQHFSVSVSPRPLSFGFGTKGFGGKGLGPGLENKRTTISACFIKILPQGLKSASSRRRIVKP